ncbi:Aste57867_12590 [Aphanomyces stellatus]|uniref:Aste57867_12590 protein n=1 Tax=Aphanomyces stellatus TaxID=120398 RepID=A0A485KWL8_9STRA|nr:hypothetical protein As57867_012544 [Aphanomyces stellatus]VFT89441.1 Aste57867_12590 [Aphanomyces stellatus]
MVHSDWLDKNTRQQTLVGEHKRVNLASGVRVMQNYRSLKKKTSGAGSSALDADKGPNGSKDHLRVDTGRNTPATRSLNNSANAGRRGNDSWNSGNTDRRVVSNGSMGATSSGTPSSSHRPPPPRTNSSQNMRHQQRTDLQEPEPSPSSSSRPSQYDLIWHQGDLALQFTLNPKGQIVIRRIETNMPKETTAGLASAAPGDILIALNWDDVSQLSTAVVQQRLNHAELPLTLTFQNASPPAPSRLNRAPSLTRMPPLQPGEYDALWSTGRLGVVIACDAAGRPIVREYAKDASTDPGVASIRPTDQLIYVNDIVVAEIGYDPAMMALKQAQKPVLLRFLRTQAPRAMHASPPTSAPMQRTPPAREIPPAPASAPTPPRRRSRETKYTIMWEDGPLGMVLKKSPSDDIFVKELKPRGLALLHKARLAEGDILVQVTGVPTKPLGLTGTVDFLKSVQKPVELVFARPTPEERARQSTMVVLPLPSDTLSNESFVSDGVAAKYLAQSSSSMDSTVAAAAAAAATGPENYDLIWHRGKLAISLRHASTHETVIRRITAGDEQTTANLDAATIGDVLVGINWTDVSHLPYEDIVARLKVRDFPLTLSFKRKPPPRLAATSSTALPRGDFEVLWRDGKLGVKIHCDPDGRAMVRTRTEDVADPELAKIQAGDELVYVNDLRVKTIGYSEALNNMKKPKPIKLRFRRRRRESNAMPLHQSIHEPTVVNLDAEASSPRQSLNNSIVRMAAEDKMYSVDWIDGSLGITLRMNDQFEIFIAHFTGKGLSLNCPDMREGDLLVGVMGVPTTPLGLAGTVDFLKCIQKPAVLTFLRKAVPNTTVLAPQPSQQGSSHNPSTPAHNVAEASAPPPQEIPAQANAPLTMPLPTAATVVSPTTSPALLHPVFSPRSLHPSSSSPSPPLSPSNQLNISLRASSVKGVDVLSPPPAGPSTPSLVPNDTPHSPVQNVSFGASATGAMPPATPPHGLPLLDPIDVMTLPSPVLVGLPVTAATPPRTPPRTSVMVSRPMPPPAPAVLSPTLSVSSEPVLSPLVLNPHVSSAGTPPATPPNVSVVISRPMVAKAAAAGTPPGTPPSMSIIDRWGAPDTARVTQPVPATEDRVASSSLGANATKPAATPPGTPPFASFGPSSAAPAFVEDDFGPPKFFTQVPDKGLDFDARAGSIADLPDFRGTENSFSLMHGDSLHRSTSGESMAQSVPWHMNDDDDHLRAGSLADLPTTATTARVIEPRLDGPPSSSWGYTYDADDTVSEDDIYGGDYTVGSDYDGSDLEDTPSSGPFSPTHLAYDVGRHNRTPTHQPPTAAASSMVPLVADSQSTESLSDEYQSSLASSGEFLSSRSMSMPDAGPHDEVAVVSPTTQPLAAHSAPAATNNATPATTRPKSALSIDIDGNVDIDDLDDRDDDDDSDDEDYSTIAPEDVPILSMCSSRSMSNLSAPPTPPPSMPPPLPDDDPAEPKTLYSVLWRGGPLGLAIKRNRDDEICVKALTGGGLAGGSDIIEAGDVLVQCGTKIVQNFTLAETSKVLKDAKTPVSLVFLRRGFPLSAAGGGERGANSVPTLDPSTSSYDNVPHVGLRAAAGESMSSSVEDPTLTSRGSVFMPKRLPTNRHSTVYSIVWEGGPLGIAVTRNSDDENCVMKLTGGGLAAQSTIIRVGDVLVAAGDVPVANLALTAAMQVIQLARKPTFLVFRRPGADDEDV